MMCLPVVSGQHSVGQDTRTHRELNQFDTIVMKSSDGTLRFEISFKTGNAHNHPTFAIWLEDTRGSYLETIYVTRSFATGIYNYADAGDGSWRDEKGESSRPAALPYWSHKRNIRNPDGSYIPSPQNPVADALTGATPKGNFILVGGSNLQSTESLVVLFEINQPWDWNSFWTNNKYPGNIDYLSSAQPSIVYAVEFNSDEMGKDLLLMPVGHGHFAGENGELFDDLSTISSALDIVESITIKITGNEE